MKISITIAISLMFGILTGYYYRDTSVGDEIREELRKQENEEYQRRKKENERLLQIFNDSGDDWEEKWEDYILEQMMNEGYPV